MFYCDLGVISIFIPQTQNGAGSGMGEITAKLFSREGAKVVATDLQEDKLKTVVDNINAEFGDVAIAAEHNVASEEDWINVVEQVKNKFGEISILVNNAGLGGKVEALIDVTLEEWNKISTVNATGTLSL